LVSDLLVNYSPRAKENVMVALRPPDLQVLSCMVSYLPHTWWQLSCIFLDLPFTWTFGS